MRLALFRSYVRFHWRCDQSKHATRMRSIRHSVCQLLPHTCVAGGGGKRRGAHQRVSHRGRKSFLLVGRELRVRGRSNDAPANASRCEPRQARGCESAGGDCTHAVGAVQHTAFAAQHEAGAAAALPQQRRSLCDQAFPGSCSGGASGNNPMAGLAVCARFVVLRAEAPYQDRAAAGSMVGLHKHTHTHTLCLSSFSHVRATVHTKKNGARRQARARARAAMWKAMVPSAFRHAVFPGHCGVTQPG